MGSISEEDKLENVEITPYALKAYLDKLLGPDVRVADVSYARTANMLSKMGFKDFQEIDKCVEQYVAKDMSKIAWRAVPGQILKFETLLLAAMGENFISGHPRKGDGAFIERYKKALSRLKEAGMQVGEYHPTPRSLNDTW